MPSQAEFKRWLEIQGHSGAAMSYPGAINDTSLHYSRQKQCNTDIYQINDAETLEPIRKLYQTNGEFGEFGSQRGGLCRAAINKYRDFLGTGEIPTVLPDDSTLSYEKDLQAALCSKITELLPGYRLKNREYSIGNKRIDVLLEKESDNSILIVELKAGVAKREVIGQILQYIGLVSEENPNHKIQGMIIAAEIDADLRTAVRGVGMADRILLKTYTIHLQLNSDD